MVASISSLSESIGQLDHFKFLLHNLTIEDRLLAIMVALIILLIISSVYKLWAK